MKSINQLYLESENDKRGHLYGAYYINSKDAKPRTDISIEHGATLKLVKGVATVNRKTIGLPTEVSPEGLTETGEVANVHTHPNEDKGTTGFSRLPGIFDFDDNGPSSRDNNPYNMRQGYLKVVVDKDNIYFFNKTGTVASLSRKKL